ncbi:MAG: hypothetical protein IH984_09865 [Planctomycetes bacterium]|nr:hypothetical protein [Planctomycetota bacterium]
MSNLAKPKYISKQNTLTSRLQQIATSVLVIGFAATVAISRIAHSIDGASKGLRVSDSSSPYLAPPRNASSNTKLDSTRSRLLNTQQLLNELVQQIRNTPSSAGPERENALKRARTIARSLQVFNRISSVPTRRIADGAMFSMCATPEDSAVAFLSTGSTFNGGSSNNGALTISLAGNQGAHQFTLASGTTQASIINAFNSFTKQTGVQASQSIENNARIQINAVDVGPDGLVHVRELDGPAGSNFIFTQPIGGLALEDLKDYGSNAITLQALKNDP